MENTQKEKTIKLLDAIKLIRKSDCGAWMKDCTSNIFRCPEGTQKRQELARLLDNLYKIAEI